MLMCTRPLVVFWWLRKNYWSYRKNNYIFGILTKFYLRKVTSYFTCRAIRGLIFSKLPPIDWSVLRSTIWNGRRYYALRCSVTCQGFSYSLTTNHLNMHDILSKHQFGFRESFSTELALIDIHDKLLSNLDNGLNSCAIFLDLAKAFDSVSYTSALVS